MRYLLILLFISFNSYSQTYNELATINSLESFKRVLIENDYEYNKKESKKKKGANVIYETADNQRFATWNKERGEFAILINKKNIIGQLDNYTDYDYVLRDVKDKCTYYGVYGGKDVTDAVFYSCSDFSYNGLVGFLMNDGAGAIFFRNPELFKVID